MTNESKDPSNSDGQAVQPELGFEEVRECWFPKCTRETIRELADMREQGYSLYALGLHSGFHEDTVARYLRAYSKYGEGPFAKSRKLVSGRESSK